MKAFQTFFIKIMFLLLWSFAPISAVDTFEDAIVKGDMQGVIHHLREYIKEHGYNDEEGVLDRYVMLASKHNMPMISNMILHTVGMIQDFHNSHQIINEIIRS